MCNRGWNEPSMPHCFSWWQANWETLTGEIICFCVHRAQATAFFCELAHFFVLSGKFPRYELLSRLETLTTPICLLGCLTTSNRWHAPVDKTRHSGRVSCQTLILTACFCWLCWDCLTMSCCSSRVFKFKNWVMFTAAWWTRPHRFVWRYVHHHNRWQWSAFFYLFIFFLDQGPEEAACWRLHQDSKRAKTSLSPHYASILSLRFRLVFALFMLVHGGTLWAFKRGGSDCISI